MTPEAGRFLDNGRQLLAEADTMFGVRLHEAAGQTPYLAGYHAAQAFIFERLPTGLSDDRSRPQVRHSGEAAERRELAVERTRFAGERLVIEVQRDAELMHIV